MVSKMIDFLLRSEMQHVHFMLNPVFGCPVKIPVQIGFGLLPAALAHGVVDRVAKARLKSDVLRRHFRVIISSVAAAAAAGAMSSFGGV